MRAHEEGQALVEFALGLPLFIASVLYAFAIVDATATQQALQAAVQRSAVVLIGSNDDAQAMGAAQSSGWLIGQGVSESIVPNGSQKRCVGQLVTLTLNAPGHLGFLLLVPTTWSSTTTAIIEHNGPQQATCP